MFGRSSDRQGIAKQAVALAFICAWVVASARPAVAHAIVSSSDPSADEVVPRSVESVVMRFNEPVEVSFGAIRVYDTNGNRVEAGDAEHPEGRPEVVKVPLDGDLPSGTYTVTWRIVSADGHPIAEAFVFHVGAPGPRPEGIADEILAAESGSSRVAGMLYGVARWVNFAALLMLAGGAIFLAAVWRRGSGSVARPVSVEHAFVRRWRTIVVTSWLAVLVATLASFVLQGAVAGDLPLSDAISASVLAAVADTRFGAVMIAKLVLLGALAVLLLVSRRLFQPKGESVGAAGAVEGPAKTTLVAGGAIVVALLATPGLSGHAATTDPTVLNVPADALHLAAGAAWMGGLVLLFAAAFPATRGLSEREAATTLALVVTRFSAMAVGAIAVIVVTGAYRAWLEVGGWSALTDATYGWVLLVKLGAFLPLVALGAINNRWTKPRIQRAVADGGPARRPLAILRRLVGVEITLALVVLALTALLVNLPPARVVAGAESGPFVQVLHTDEYRYDLLVDPNEVGENEVHVTVNEHSGAPARIRDLRVLFRMPSEDIGPIIGRGRRLAKGHFVVQGHQLSVAGDWQLEIVARVGRFDEARATVNLLVAD